jgi:hypothetical protein
MNYLRNYFDANSGRLIDKYLHYFEAYDRHFSKYRGKEIVLLEIGISHGGSLQMWKNYFGGKAKTYGIDIDPRCKDFEEENIEIFIGSQSDKNFLKEVKAKIPKVDILIDDGGHTMMQQIISYEELFAHVKDDGVYPCEDLHTSYWLIYGGGIQRKGTFIEYSKNFIDQLNAFHTRQSSYQPNDFTKTVNSLHYYDSMLFIEKRTRNKPTNESRGIMSFEPEIIKRTKAERLKRDIKKGYNKILQSLKLKGSDLY